MLTMGLRILGVLFVVAYFFYDNTDLPKLMGDQGKLALFIIGFGLYLAGAVISGMTRMRQNNKLGRRNAKDDFDLDEK